MFCSVETPEGGLSKASHSFPVLQLMNTGSIIILSPYSNRDGFLRLFKTIGILAMQVTITGNNNISVIKSLQCGI